MGNALEKLQSAGFGTEELRRLYLQDDRSVKELLAVLQAAPVEITEPQLKGVLSTLGIKKSPEARKAAQASHSLKRGSTVAAAVLETGLTPTDEETLTAYVRRLQKVLPEQTEREVLNAVKRLKLVRARDHSYLKDTKPELQEFYRGETPFESLTTGGQLKLPWECARGHRFELNARDAVRSVILCLYCKGRKVLAGFNDLQSQEPEIALDWSPLNSLKADEIHRGSNSHAHWLCFDCGYEWTQVVQNRTVQGAGCPGCKSRGSRFERQVFRVLQEAYSGAMDINGYPLHDKAKRYQIDIYLPELRLGFEIQDFATHSRYSDSEELQDPWRYRAIRQGVKPLKKGPTYHALKHKLAEEADILLVELWQNELHGEALLPKLQEAIAEAEARLS